MNDVEMLELTPFGFMYDPFSHLDASRDPNLIQHLVIPHTASIMLREMPTIVFAPPGGGKSALRLYTEHSLMDASARSFTITYLPDPDEILPAQPDLEDHFRRLATCTATDLLRHAFNYPSQFMRLPAEERQRVVAALMPHLQVELEYLLDILAGENPAQASKTCLEMLGREFFLIKFPSAATLQGLVTCLRASVPDKLPEQALTFSQLVSLAFEVFQIREIFILLDGIDAAPQTIHNPERAAMWLLPLIDHAQALGNQRIYLKAYLTSEIEPALRASYPEGRLPITFATITWDQALLSEVLRRRVSAASGTNFGSLDGISASYLRDVESKIVARLPENYQLPREAIVITRQIFIEALQRYLIGDPAQLVEADLSSAFQWYYALPNRRHITPPQFRPVEI